MLPQLRRYLLENWSELPLDGPQPRDLAFIVQGTGVSKLCCYVFPDEAAQPRWVAKVARSPRDNETLVREYELIEYLRRHGSDFVRATVPKPLLTAPICGHLVGIEAYFPGRPMDGLLVDLARRGQLEIGGFLDLALGWLLRSQRETAIRRGLLAEEQIHTHLLMPIAQLRATARLTAAELVYLERLSERVVELARRPLPLVFNHGDFRPGNVLADGSSILVIDWEFGASTALPLMDVFGLLARTYARCHALEEIDGYLEDYLAAFEAVFLVGGRFAQVTGEYVRRACRELNVDPAWVDTLFALHLVTEANKYHSFLSHRAEKGYIYLLRSRAGELGTSHTDRLARQKNVWLLGHLAKHEQRLVFRDAGVIAGQPPGKHPPDGVEVV